MSEKNSLRTHRNWEDWLGITLGIVIALAPWIQNEISHTPALANAAIAGIVVLMLAELDLVRFRSWPEAGLVIVGLWVAVSPFVLGYGATGTLRYWHVVCGALVALLGALGLWQRQSAGP